VMLYWEWLTCTNTSSLSARIPFIAILSPLCSCSLARLFQEPGDRVCHGVVAPLGEKGTIMNCNRRTGKTYKG
jgi:hypothetical protein